MGYPSSSDPIIWYIYFVTVPKGFAVGLLRFADVHWFAARRDLPKQLEGVRLESPFLMFPCKGEGMLSVVDRLSPKASRQTRLAQARNNA